MHKFKDFYFIYLSVSKIHGDVLGKFLGEFKHRKAGIRVSTLST